VRMTHASVKPRIGDSYDFAPDEDEEETMESTATETKPFAPHVRTRTTIIIPDSPPLRPVDRKGKGRARDEDLDEVWDLEADDWIAPHNNGTSVSTPGSSSSRGKKRKRQAVEIVEVLSDDESDSESGHASASTATSAASSQSVKPEKMQTVLVCASCRRPLRTGGDKLWALRCGHMIDSRCYRKLAEQPASPDDIVAANEEAVVDEGQGKSKRRRKASGGRSKGKGKDKAPAPVLPKVVETHEWACPVSNCRRTHWSERVVTGSVSVWQPMKETGAIGVFV